MIQDGIWKDVRIVLGGVATSPYRSREAEDLLRSKQISEAGAAEAAEAALQLAKPLKMNGYKVELQDPGRALLSLAG